MIDNILLDMFIKGLGRPCQVVQESIHVVDLNVTEDEHALAGERLLR